MGAVVVLMGAGSSVTFAQPALTFEPLSPTTVTVPADGSVSVLYQVTNQRPVARMYTMMPIQGVQQVSNGPGRCSPQMALPGGESCLLDLLAVGSQIPANGVHGGPVLCVQGNLNQCYQPQAAHVLNVSVGAPSRALLQVVPTLVSFAPGTSATLTVSHIGGAPVVVENLRLVAPPGIAIDVDPGTCAAPLAPGASCQLMLGATTPLAATMVVEADNAHSVSIVVIVSDLIFSNGFEAGQRFHPEAMP